VPSTQEHSPGPADPRRSGFLHLALQQQPIGTVSAIKVLS
jgi:hypothetical protein